VFAALCWVMKKNGFNDASYKVTLMPKDWKCGSGWEMVRDPRGQTKGLERRRGLA
jgi:hypothetical protein